MAKMNADGTLASNPKGNISDRAATPGQVTDLVMREAQRRGHNWFKPFHASGMVGSFMQETGNFRRDVLNFKVRGDDGSAHGLMQWRGKRYQNLISFAKRNNMNPTDLNTQVSFAFEEMDRRSQYADFGSVKALKEFQTARNAQDTALSFIHAERPAGYDGNTRNAHDAAKRVGHATKALNDFGNGRSGGSSGGPAQSGQYAEYEDSLLRSGANTGGGFRQPSYNDDYQGGDRAVNDESTDARNEGTLESDRFGLNKFINDKSNNPFLAGKNTTFKSLAGNKPQRFSAFGAGGGYDG